MASESRFLSVGKATTMLGEGRVSEMLVSRPLYPTSGFVHPFVYFHFLAQTVAQFVGAIDPLQQMSLMATSLSHC